jgi:hypothetical protein
MSHLDEGTLHALLDGELEGNEVAEIQAHLGSCSSCGLRLREVKEFLAEADRLIASVDVGVPAAAAAPRPEPVAAAQASARPEAQVPPRREPEPRAEERPRPEPSRPAESPRPSPRDQPPAGWEPWNEQVPVILVPDNESPAERRGRLMQRFGWAAMVLILIGAGIVGRMSRPTPTLGPPATPATVARADSGAVVSPEEANRPAQPVAQAAESDRTPLALKPVAKPAAKAAATPARSQGKRLATRADTTRVDTARQEVARAAGVNAGADSVAADSAAEASAADTATEDLATVRQRASEALAQLDREKRRNQAAAATAALDAERRRRTTQAAPAPAAPPTPPTVEERAQVYLRIGLDEASRQLGGPVHVIEGLSPMFMGLTQGVVVPGADATRPVVRVVYQDAQGRLIFLDQQRLRTGQAPPTATPLSWMYGGTAMWLHGEAGPEILRTYRARVR